MDENWTLMKMGQPETPTQSEWLQQNLESGSVIGVDPFLCTIAQWNDLKTGLDKSGHRLVRGSASMTFGPDGSCTNDIFLKSQRTGPYFWGGLFPTLAELAGLAPCLA